MPYLSLGLILLVAIGLLSAVIFFIVALQLRKQLNTPRAGVTDKAVYRAHARRFRAWFAAHTFIWTVLAGSSTLILLFLFGFRPLIFAYATAALTCTLYGAYGLSWLRSPRELGICWESEVLNLNRDAGYWARSNTILLLWDRFAAALREDLQRVRPKSRILLVAFAGTGLERRRIVGLQEPQPWPTLVWHEFYERGRAFALPFVSVLLLALLFFTVVDGWLVQTRPAVAGTLPPIPGLGQEPPQDGTSVADAGSPAGQPANEDDAGNEATGGGGAAAGETGAQNGDETADAAAGEGQATGSGSSGDAAGAGEAGESGESGGGAAQSANSQGGGAQSGGETGLEAMEGQGDSAPDGDAAGQNSSGSSTATGSTAEANNDAQGQPQQNEEMAGDGDSDGQSGQATDGASGQDGGEGGGGAGDEQGQTAQGENSAADGEGEASAGGSSENTNNGQPQDGESGEGAGDASGSRGGEGEASTDGGSDSMGNGQPQDGESGESAGDASGSGEAGAEDAGRAGDEQGDGKGSEANGTAGGAGGGDAMSGGGEMAEEGGSGGASGAASDSRLGEPEVEDSPGRDTGEDVAAPGSERTTPSRLGPRFDIDLPSMSAMGTESQPPNEPRLERTPAPPQGPQFVPQPEGNRIRRGPLQTIPNWILALIRALER